MIKLCDNLAPKPMTVAPCLAETALLHRPVSIDTGEIVQRTPAMASIHPNTRPPVWVNNEAAVFNSNTFLIWRRAA